MTISSEHTPSRMNSTQAWVSYLSKVELPVLANTLRQINELTDNRNSTVNELANVILNDAQLTSQVLRLSNTVFYNQTRTQVSTVSRAITLIGFDSVKSMAISSLIVDALLKRNDRPHLLRCLARAIHAAVQARCLMPKRTDHGLEEVFIGALLMNIGELAFWSCETDQAAELEARLRLDEPPVDAQKAVLHTTFTEITRGLVDAWSLGPFIREVVAPGKANSMASSLVRNTVAMASTCEHGWSGPAMDKVLERLSADIGESPAVIRDQLKVNAQEATKVAVSLGIPQVTALLPGNQDNPASSTAEAPTMDPALQLQILRDLTQTLAEKPDINEVCQLVIEGIHRAVGMQRVALLMSDRTGHKLTPRKVGGRGTDEWREHLII
ncbi:MAG: HDOD domain-containing protein, partial [Marinobacter sp.]